MDSKKPDDVMESLERLQRLRDSGLLTDEEVARQKADILASRQGAPGHATDQAAGLSVRPETQKKISESRRSGGGRGILLAILIIAALGVGAYFGAQALNMDVPGIATVARADLDVSISRDNVYGQRLIIQSRMEHVVVTGVTANRGQCDLRNPSTHQRELLRAAGSTVSAIKELGLTEAQARGWLSKPIIDFPVALKLGEELKISYDGDCNVIEAVVHSDSGDVSVAF